MRKCYVCDAKKDSGVCIPEDFNYLNFDSNRQDTYEGVFYCNDCFNKKNNLLKKLGESTEKKKKFI